MKTTKMRPKTKFIALINLHAKNMVVSLVVVVFIIVVFVWLSLLLRIATPKCA